jgi:predicted porin
MNKKLIAAAIAAVVAAPAVSAADTTLYGKAHVSVQSNDTGSSDNYTATSNASRLGVKGSEDLGDGLKAIFGYEMGYDITDGGANGPVSARNAFVGMAGGFGTLLVGRHDTPAKVAFYAAGNDLLGDSVIDFNKIGFTEVRTDNAIAYISPNFSGFTVAAAVVPGEQSGNPTTLAAASTITGDFGMTITIPAGQVNANASDGIADAYSLGLMYAGGGLKASVGYEVLGDSYNIAGTTADHKMWQLGASYTFGDFQIGAQYEDTSDYGTISGLDKTVWGIAGKANFGNNYIIANYGNADYDMSGTGSDDVDTFGIAVGHVFSKRTQVYAAYANSDGGSAASPIGLDYERTNFSLGMIHSF